MADDDPYDASQVWPPAPTLGGPRQDPTRPPHGGPFWRLWGGLGVLAGVAAAPAWDWAGSALRPQAAAVGWELGGFILPLSGLLLMRRVPRYAHFGEGVLMTHALVGGIWTLGAVLLGRFG